MKDEHSLFNEVTGLDLHGHGEEFLAQVIISCLTVWYMLVTSVIYVKFPCASYKV